MNPPFVIVISGPTAVGKTKLAISLAKKFNASIISADSRQFYKEMRIGTAKPSQDELEQVPHHFINNISITQSYSVGDFEKEVLVFLDDYFKSNKIIFIVGGSGLYIDAVTKGLDYFPEVDIEIRKQVNDDFESKGLEFLQKELQDCDIEYYNEVDIQNPQRIIRAIEIFRSSGKPFSSFRQKESKSRPFNVIKIAIIMDRAALYKKINLRVDEMMENGLLDEVRSLTGFSNLNALQTVGYQELFAYLADSVTLKEAVDLIKRNTRRYAKRQLTWFKRDPENQWFDTNDPGIIESFIIQEMKKK